MCSTCRPCPHLDGPLGEVDVADPQPAQLDAPQAEPLGQDERDLVEQRVPAGLGELAEQGSLLHGEAAPARLGAGGLAEPRRDVVGHVALLDQVAPQVPEGGDGVLLGRPA
jgi:hypothetical protein